MDTSPASVASVNASFLGGVAAARAGTAGEDATGARAPADTAASPGKPTESGGIIVSGKTQGQGRTSGSAKTGGDSVVLSPEAKALVARLQARDAGVRAHEQAHMSAAGSLVTGSATYSYERGPDGKQYAVGGEVSIDTSAVPNNPRATLAKAQQIQAAALAPADPSGQDRSVANQAQAMAARATAELATVAVSGGGAAGGRSRQAGAMLDVTA
jgi:hypothetical protein